MNDRERFYLRLPRFLQNITCSLEGWRIQRTRYGPGFDEQFQAACERENWSTDRISSYRDERLGAFIQHCAQTVPYYQKLFREHGIDPGSIRRLDDLGAIPILTKAVVQQNYADLLSTGVSRRDRVMIHTSGTTGGGLRFATTWRSIHEQHAVWWRYWCRHGLQRGTWCGFFGGRSVVPIDQQKPPFWRYNYPGRQILFSGYHLSPSTFDTYVRELNKRRPPWLHGYPSSLALLGSFLLEQKRRLDYAPDWITIGAENLLPQQATIMEAAFGRRPVQHYGMAEGIANCSQCRKGKLHVDEDFAATEFVPIDGDDRFRVIGTNFTNLATPLLRYEVGDVVEVGDDSCDCGLPGRIVREVDGRREDYIVLRNGARLGRMDHIFKDMMSIREAQIYQDTPGIIFVRIIPNASYNADEECVLRQEIRKRVGDLVDVHIECVEQLQRSTTGKLRFVISRIKQGQLEKPALSG